MNRIIGLNVARALAIFGMIIVNFKIALGQFGDGFLKTFANMLDGKAAAIFVVVAGMGISLMAKSEKARDTENGVSVTHKKILKRSIFLLITGLLFSLVWPGDILHYYGIYMLIILFFIDQKDVILITGTIIIISLFPLLYNLFDYSVGWDFSRLAYLDFWTIKGFFRNLVFNGFHPIIPWFSFMLFGLWFGRRDLDDMSFLKKSFLINLIFFICIQVVSRVCIHFIGGNNPFEQLNAYYTFGTYPMPPMPIYMLNGITFATMIISLCILLGRAFPDSRIINVLNKTGQIALTLYVAHILIGIKLVQIISSKPPGWHSIYFSVIFAIIFSAASMLFAVLWLKYKKRGPLEWLIRKISDQ